MLFQSLVGAALALAANAAPTNEQQPILKGDFKTQQVDLIKEFVFFYAL